MTEGGSTALVNFITAPFPFGRETSSAMSAVPLLLALPLLLLPLFNLLLSSLLLGGGEAQGLFLFRLSVRPPLAR